MCFSSPSAPAAAPPPKVATEQDPVVQRSLDAEQRRRRQGLASTILTAPQGVLAPTGTAPKTILGS